MTSLSRNCSGLAHPNRPYAQVPPRTPPYFCSIDRNDAPAWSSNAPARPLQEKVKSRWRGFLLRRRRRSSCRRNLRGEDRRSDPARYRNTKTAVEKPAPRGANRVRPLPAQRDLKVYEDRATPRAQTWNLTPATGAARNLLRRLSRTSGFTCPEWSHLSAAIRRIHETPRPPSAHRPSALIYGVRKIFPEYGSITSVPLEKPRTSTKPSFGAYGLVTKPGLFGTGIA